MEWRQLNLISIGIKKDQMICLATDMRVKFKYSLTSVILPRWDRHLHPSDFKSNLAEYGSYIHTVQAKRNASAI